MLQIVRIRPNGDMTGYGLGIVRYKRVFSNGKKAYGHSGANIGTSAYMIHIPKIDLTAVVMINNMNHECSSSIVKDIVKISLRELNAYSIIPIVDFFPYGLFIIVASVFWLSFIIILIRRRIKRNSE